MLHFSRPCAYEMMGSGCGPIGKSQSISVIRVANLWAAEAPTSYAPGLHRFRFDVNASLFSADTLAASPHEAFWRLFDKSLKEISAGALDSRISLSIDTITRQAVSTKLDQLRKNLSFMNNSGASWLTQVRNSINYDHEFSAWYPYEGRQKYCKNLYKQVDSWKQNAMEIELSSYEGEELMRFQATCNFILAICRETIEEMSDRCSNGHSFHQSGALAYFNLTHRTNAKASGLKSSKK